MSSKEAKEKAKELYDFYLPLVKESYLYDTYHNKAKRCALRAVDEIINSAPLRPTEILNPVGWWLEVKQEIENL